MTQVDLRVNGLDLLPDVLGYLLVVVTAYQLRALDRRLAPAAWCAALAAPLSIASLDRPTGNLVSKTGDPRLDLVLALADVCDPLVHVQRRDRRRPGRRRPGSGQARSLPA